MACAHHLTSRTEQDAMRAALALVLPMMLWSTAADAGTVRHLRARHHVIVRPSEEGVPSGRYVYPGYGPIPPGENRNLDPSTRGGG
jgi:hypothetical protein